MEAHNFHRLGAEVAAPPDADHTVYAPDHSGDTDEAEQAPAGTQLGSTPEAIARRLAARTARKQKGLLIVNTGQGKGKTTAALGVCCGPGAAICASAACSSSSMRTPTSASSRAGQDAVELTPMGDGFTWTSRDMDETQAKALHGWELAKQRISAAI